ncbi:MAG: hypothetical protein NZ901_03320 [Geminocystis sp.]|nr:hypothetical protein [Geminocystis sp.]HIK38023.1 hypothetical protein [Geminocystis sp. M7585_C2015_104]MCS7147202.1 hypothetical protein [Geminocystis sp.]MCX8078573.1 hypothetical protein [Geminocystis sp.]MDW8116198.1 hypothetical protein [Geminocystis sp.]
MPPMTRGRLPGSRHWRPVSGHLRTHDNDRGEPLEAGTKQGYAPCHGLLFDK